MLIEPRTQVRGRLGAMGCLALAAFQVPGCERVAQLQDVFRCAQILFLVLCERNDCLFDYVLLEFHAEVVLLVMVAHLLQAFVQIIDLFYQYHFIKIFYIFLHLFEYIVDSEHCCHGLAVEMGETLTIFTIFLHIIL